MIRIVKWMAVLMIVGVIALLVFAPGMVEQSTNKISGTPEKASVRAEALHKTLTIADLHADTLLWQRDLTKAALRGHVDLPRLEGGNVALQVFSSVTKTPKNQNYDSNNADTDNITLLAITQSQPFRTWNSLLERSLWHAQKAGRAVSASQGRMVAISTASHIKGLQSARVRGVKTVGLLLSIEGLHNLEGRAENLDKLFNAGYRMAGLVHFFDNELSGSMHGVKKGGLTPFGRQIVQKMEAKGMIVDIAHSSHRGVADILAMSTRPVVSSHGGVQATCKVNRNLSDDEIKGVAKTGGVIGIGYWDAAVCDLSPASIVRAIKHVRDLVGIDHVGLGSDYDGATTVAFDTSQLVLITQALIDTGFTDDDIAKVMGGNVMRLLGEGLPAR